MPCFFTVDFVAECLAAGETHSFFCSSVLTEGANGHYDPGPQPQHIDSRVVRDSQSETNHVHCANQKCGLGQVGRGKASKLLVYGCAAQCEIQSLHLVNSLTACLVTFQTQQ